MASAPPSILAWRRPRPVGLDDDELVEETLLAWRFKLTSKRIVTAFRLA
jgi:hypothetical protein